MADATARQSGVTVKKFGIHGKGVFAARGFTKGEVVIKWDLSETVSPSEETVLPERKKTLPHFL
ncbi:TPA: hypothetical protein HA318_06005 [Candidatus Micrarchaeota archaeon]|nr:MAG: hypothetical protein AUJ65_03060 [Candidatus Micrarchaeota archaeon CG1_02_51_15]HII39523.1 hypothetical protein [Candidatus Micrarchaeota archaeon]